MDRTTAVLLTALMGGAVALQAPINSGLGKRVGTFQGAFLSFVIGACLLCVIAALSHGGLGNLAAARHVRWYYLVGGLLGAGYVTTVLVTVRTLGAGGVTAATISGQLIMAVVIDQLGLLGVARHPVSALRLAGIVLLACGTYLVVRE